MTKQKITIPFSYFLALFIIMVFSIYGMSLNYIVIQSNEGKMPVKTSFVFSDYHIAYTYDNEVNNSHLTDKYLINGTYYSIGDLIMLISLFLFVLLAILIFSYVFQNYILTAKQLKKTIKFDSSNLK